MLFFPTSALGSRTCLVRSAPPWLPIGALLDFLLRRARQRVPEGSHNLRALRLAHPQAGVRHVGVRASLPLHNVAARAQLAAQGRVKRKPGDSLSGLFLGVLVSW